LQTLFKVSLTSLFCRKDSIPLSLPHGPLVIADQPSLICGSLSLGTSGVPSDRRHEASKSRSSSHLIFA
jgi:hypothetical protein